MPKRIDPQEGVRILMEQGEISPMQAQVYVYARILHEMVPPNLCTSRSEAEIEDMLHDVERKLSHLRNGKI